MLRPTVWPPAEVAGVAGLYVSGSSLGGFCGRFIPGVLADLVGWRAAFLALAAITVGTVQSTGDNPGDTYTLRIVACPDAPVSWGSPAGTY